MDYLKIYNKIIERAKLRKLEGYKEIHHIIPKCLGGNNLKYNLVDLTAKEHFICHQLLCEIYPSNDQLKQALWLMASTKEKYKASGRLYERAKLDFIKIQQGKKHNDETINKMKEWWKVNKKSRSKEIINKIKQTKLENPRITTPEMVEKYRNSSTLKKSIIQCDLKGKKIKEYESINEASRQTGIGNDCISACARGKQNTSGGFKWKYKNL